MRDSGLVPPPAGTVTGCGAAAAAGVGDDVGVGEEGCDAEGIAVEEIDVGSGIGIRSGARLGIGGISMVVGSSDGSGIFEGEGSDDAVSGTACIRAKGVIGIGARLPPVSPAAGGDWMDLKNGSARTSLAGRAISRPMSP
jgi:hypothetical protein